MKKQVGLGAILSQIGPDRPRKTLTEGEGLVE